MHDSGASLAGLLALARGGTTIENLSILSKALPEHADARALAGHQLKLHALLGVKAAALESLVALQRGYVANVNGDAAASDDLSRLEATHDQFRKAAQDVETGSSEQAQLLAEQLAEINSGLTGAQETFESFRAVNDERNAVFANFSGVERDNLNEFRLNLVHHLSSQIVVKESRYRYQKEQFERMLMASHMPQLKRNAQDLDEWCRSYAQLIEHQIDLSHNGKSPKI